VPALTAAEAESPFASDLDRITVAISRLRELAGSLLGSEVEPLAEVASAVEADLPEGPQTVLVVDDDEANRDVLSRRLERLGYGVAQASDGQQALDAVATGGIDLVLLDLMMPVLDGLAVLERRRDDQAFRDIPVIMISASDELDSVVRCIELGADDYLSKPFDPVLLKARVGASLEKKRLHDREKHLLSEVTKQAAELTRWNQELEQIVAEKVQEVERLSVMERFVPPQLAEMIASGGTELLRSHRREITVLFCDLRGFTSFAETAEPEDVMSVLHELHIAVGPRVFHHGGTLAYFTGDGMMVFFNDPIPCDDPAWKAVQLATDMQASAAELAVAWRRRGHRLELGVGIAIGYATCGQVGFEGRFEYTAIGNVTNLASRLCGEAKGGETLVSERVFTMVEDRVQAEAAGELVLKGLARPVPAFVLKSITAPITS
jgi:class 3 adenylate cyclase/AmiR/NasT family two-component response regulator